MALAAHASAKQKHSPTARRAPGVRSCDARRNQPGVSQTPSDTESRRKPTVFIASPATAPPGLVPAAAGAAHAVTAPSSTSASTSSTMAAPRMILASRAREAFMSRRTRAVMPTLVAASAAPRNTCAAAGAAGRRSFPARKPRARLEAVPRIATTNDEAPTDERSRTERPNPTSNNRRTMPTCARMSRYESEPRKRNVWRPGTLPSTMPAMSSPRTAGWPKRTATCPPAIAAVITRARPSASLPSSSSAWPCEIARPTASKATPIATSTR
jgi:hypothetical protein